MRRVAIVGAGYTKFGECWDKSLRRLAQEAGMRALADAQVEGKDIEALFVGNMTAGRFIGQEHLSALAADRMGLTPIPSTRIEAACASGALAFRKALMAIQSGQHDIVVAGGVEKMTDVGGDSAVASLMGAADQEWESQIGLTFTGLYALITRAHMQQYGTTSEQLALVSVNNHKNGVHNPNAQYPFEITVEQVLKSPLIADPLRLLDCSPITDGAATVVLASEEAAKRFENPIWVIGSGQASDTIALHDRKSFTELQATIVSSRVAYKQAGIRPEQVDLVEVHDCFSINEIIAIEDLGFCKKGEGGKFVEAGKIARDGERPINTMGGLKSIGHPVGATGIRQLADLVTQLRGKAGKLQVNDAKIGLALNIGGSGATGVTHILANQNAL